MLASRDLCLPIIKEIERNKKWHQGNHYIKERLTEFSHYLTTDHHQLESVQVKRRVSEGEELGVVYMTL